MESLSHLDMPWDAKDMGCGCALASVALMRLLDAAGIECTLLLGEFKGMTHCWIQVEDTYIDITATQFGDFERVHVEISGSSKHYTTHAAGEGALLDLAAWAEQAPVNQPIIMRHLSAA